MHHDKVQEVQTGARGRPRKEVNASILRNAFQGGRMIRQAPLARVLGIHRNTLRNSMKRQGFAPPPYSEIPNEELDMLFQSFHEENSRRGLLAFTGHLREHNIRVQQRRLVACIRRCVPLELALEPIIAAVRAYHVTRPNKLWHCDGYHKLIRWGFVIHGFVDGYCREVSLSILLLQDAEALRSLDYAYT